MNRNRALWQTDEYIQDEFNPEEYAHRPDLTGPIRQVIRDASDEAERLRGASWKVRADD